MAPTRKPRKPLEPGTVVGIANCVDTGRVVERLAPNVYRVEWKGRVVEIHRSQLAVVEGVA